MTFDELKRRFPQAGPGFIAANLDSNNPRTAAQPKPDSGPLTLAASQAEKENRSRFLVRVTSIRKRLLDEDNLVPKFHVDLLRYAGVLPFDTPETCHIETRQVKAAKGQEEHILITVYSIP